MFFAGSKTVQTATSNLIVTMTHEPEIYADLRKEIDDYMTGVSDDIMEKMTLETVEDLELVKMCYQETMRLDPPAGMSKVNSMTKDICIDGVNMRKDDTAFIIGTQLMQRDPVQWMEPMLFNP